MILYGEENCGYNNGRALPQENRMAWCGRSALNWVAKECHIKKFLPERQTSNKHPRQKIPKDTCSKEGIKSFAREGKEQERNLNKHRSNQAGRLW